MGAVFHHEKECGAQTCKNGQKSDGNEILHKRDYQRMTHIPQRPRFWLLTVAALLVFGGTFSLGQWQLRRAAQKEALAATIESKSNEPILNNLTLRDFNNTSEAVHRQATLKGIWQSEHTVFLDNRPMNGKTGFVVVTPLVLDGSSHVILVQRGWVPRDFTDRTRLPNVTTPIGPVTVRGRIAPPPSKLYEFKGVESGRIRQNIDLPTFAGEIRTPLMAVSMLQTGLASEGLLRNWAAPNLGVDKHYGYAFQWFGLCALVFGLYVWFQIISPLRPSRKSAKLDQPHVQSEST